MNDRYRRIIEAGHRVIGTIDNPDGPDPTAYELDLVAAALVGEIHGDNLDRWEVAELTAALVATTPHGLGREFSRLLSRRLDAAAEMEMEEGEGEGR